jgi:high-affinity iron transporter
VLATFVIGLREGLEAALIVGIIAAFLKRNGASLRPMWIGVGSAVVLSVAVGFVLHLIEAALPQAQQEAMETVIGAVAVFFVTTMIVWMKKHARGMKKELEREAAAALGAGTTWALAGMAFLAVLKEGFETSVFLLATFQASASAGAAALGAVLGIVAAVAIGVGIYTGGVRLNLGSFFTVTGVFLVFVAAGLVVSTLRTAHEAGWLTIGQQPTVDLSWLAPRGSIQAALITGVLGMPADPRVVELLGWALYLVPVLALSLWPARWAPAQRLRPRLEYAGAAALVVAAVALAALVPGGGHVDVPSSAPLAGGGSVSFHEADAMARLTTSRSGHEYVFRASDATASSSTGADTVWRRTITAHRDGRPATLTLDRLVTLTGGRLPVGIDAMRNPGPFQTHWTDTMHVSAWTRAHGLVDAQAETITTVRLSGGGLAGPRTVTISAPTGSPPDAGSWRVQSRYVNTISARIEAAQHAAAESLLWRLLLPLVLVIAAAALVASGARFARQRRRVSAGSSEPTPTSGEPAAAAPRSTPYAVK